MKKHTKISKQNTEIIMHSRKSLPFDKNTAWVKKGDNNLFDVTMGSYDGAEVCELVGLYILHNLGNKYGKENIGLYRDDGLAAFNKTSGPQAERIKKDFQNFFKELGLKIEIKTNLKVVDFLNVTFNLTTEMYYPFKKPNDEPTYMNTKSNHPPNIIKQIPASISRRISGLSCNKEVCERAKPYYNERLKSSGYREELSYTNPKIEQTRGKTGKEKLFGLTHHLVKMFKQK